MKILLLHSQKGGSGKSTLAVHMAVCAARHGQKTVLIDLDPQASAYDWNESRDEARKLDATKATAAQLAARLQQAKAGSIDLAIIDTAPHSDSAAAIAAQITDLLLIPCRPARFDLAAMIKTLEIARAANTTAVVVLNAARRGKRKTAEARAALESIGANVYPSVIHDWVALEDALIDGRAVHEYEPDSKAAEEIEELYNHISRLLGDITSKRRVA